MLTRRLRWMTMTCSFALFASHALAAPPAGKGNGGKDDPAPVTYEIRYLGDPFGIAANDDYIIQDMNNVGDIVGYASHADGHYTPFLFKRDTGFLDLREFPALDEWSALGWTLVVPFGINDPGQIIMTMVLDDGTKGMFRYDPPDDAADPSQEARFTFIDVQGILGLSTTRTAVNNWGDVVYMYYDADGSTYWKLFTDADGVEIPTIGGAPIPGFPTGINDLREIVGSDDRARMVVRYSAATGTALYIDDAVGDHVSIDERGDFCFDDLTQHGKVGKGAIDIAPARYVEATGQTELVLDEGFAQDINAAGDVCVWSSGSVYVCPDAGGAIEVGDANVVGDPQLVELWRSRWRIESVRMNDADGSSDFGELCGDVSIPDEFGNLYDFVFVLSPVAVPQ